MLELQYQRQLRNTLMALKAGKGSSYKEMFESLVCTEDGEGKAGVERVNEAAGKGGETGTVMAAMARWMGVRRKGEIGMLEFVSVLERIQDGVGVERKDREKEDVKHPEIEQAVNDFDGNFGLVFS